MQVNQKTDPSSTNEIHHSRFTIFRIYGTRFTIYDLRFRIYDLGFTIFRIYDTRFTIYDLPIIHHPHSHPINFQKHLRKSAQAIRVNQRETKRKNQRETRKNKKYT